MIHTSMHFEAPRTNSLYPERHSAGIDRRIEALERLETGKDPKIELSEEETAELLGFENKLGDTLESIHKLTPIRYTFYAEYFLTEAGRKDFFKTTGLEITGETPEDVIVSILKSRQAIQESVADKSIAAKKIAGLFGNSINFFNDSLFLELSKQKSADGSLNIDPETPLSNRAVILLTPDIALKKIDQLRTFKKFLKEKLAELGSETAPGPSLQAGLREVLILYKRKVNTMITGQIPNAIAAKNTADILRHEDISDAEKSLADLNDRQQTKTFPSLSDPESALARYDKFIHGASREYNTAGNRNQISLEIAAYADEIEKAYLENALSKPADIRKKGLDPNKILDETLSLEQYLPWAEELLEACGEKSAYPGSTYDPSREGPAPDNKWQIITGPEFKTNGIDPKRKTYKLGHTQKKKRSIENVVSVVLGHEIAHIFQKINRDALPIKLLGQIGSDRRGLYSEGGAMYLQDLVSTEAFGTRSIPMPHYVRAMSRRLRGGNYLDCLSAYYDSAYKILKAQLDAGTIDEETFQERTLSLLKTAINSTKRLFASSDDLSAQSSVLTQSDDTSYLEQRLLMEKLKAIGKENYAYLGINLDTIISLTKLGLFDAAKIKTPPLYALKLWDKIKDVYKLPSSGNSPAGEIDKDPDLL